MPKQSRVITQPEKVSFPRLIASSSSITYLEKDQSLVNVGESMNLLEVESSPYKNMRRYKELSEPDLNFENDQMNEGQ